MSPEWGPYPSLQSRNPKHEIRNKLQTPSTKGETLSPILAAFRVLAFLPFMLVSDFDIRNLSLLPQVLYWACGGGTTWPACWAAWASFS
jgi:hypothetical protein